MPLEIGSLDDGYWRIPLSFTFTLYENSFNSPEPGEITTVTVTNTTLDPGSWTVNIVNGNFATQQLIIDPSFSDIGVHTFTYTATDDGVPSQTTIKTVIVDISTSGDINITGERGFCIGDSTQLFINPGYISYLWGNGETDFEIYATQEGYYSLTIQDGTCIYTDSVYVVEHPLPTPTFVTDLVNPNCEGDTVIVTLNQNYRFYEWHDGSENDSLIVTTNLRYSVNVIDTNKCEATIEDTISFLPNPVLEIIANDSLDLSVGESLQLDAGSHAFYSWSNGSTS